MTRMWKVTAFLIDDHHDPELQYTKNNLEYEVTERLIKEGTLIVHSVEAVECPMPTVRDNVKHDTSGEAKAE